MDLNEAAQRLVFMGKITLDHRITLRDLCPPHKGAAVICSSMAKADGIWWKLDPGSVSPISVCRTLELGQKLTTGFLLFA